MVEQVYRPRRPSQSPLWQCLSRHFDDVLAGYEERYQPRYGFLRPIIPEVVNKFLDCGDLARGFARVRCDECNWYSNKMRGQRDKRGAEEAKAAGQTVQTVDVCEHKPRRIPSAKWRELIKKVWEADPLLCPKCQKELRIVALINERDAIERILRHLGLWQQGVRVSPARAPPEIAEWVIEPWLDDPFPDYDTEPVMMYANG